MAGNGRRSAIREFVEMLIMRIEQDYDSAIAALLVVVTVVMATYNPFIPSFPILPPGLLLLSPTDIGHVTGMVSFFRQNVLFDSFVLSMASALILFFRNMSYGAVAEIQDGTMANFVLLPGGRRAAFISIVISSAVIPYLLSSLAVLFALSLSHSGLYWPYLLLILGLNFLSMLGLTAVTLWSGLLTRKPSYSIGYGLAYLVMILVSAVSVFSSPDMAYFAGLFAPSLSANAFVVTAVNGTLLSPVLSVSGSRSLAAVGGVLAEGAVFNIAVLYLLYSYWMRKAAF